MSRSGEASDLVRPDLVRPRSTQSLVQEYVEHMAVSHGFVLATDYTASNCGVWRFFHEWDVCAEIVFDFQMRGLRAYASFSCCEESFVCKGGAWCSALSRFEDWLDSLW